jgi:hypothetical protein
MVQLHHENESSTGASGYSQGVLAIFDSNGEKVKAEYIIMGETAESSMHALLKKSGIDPCAPNGPRPRIAAFAPPATVDLPISFTRCSTLRDQVKLLTAQTRALRQVLAANARNRKDLDRVAADIAKISSVQQESWTRAIDMLTEMTRRVQGGAGK